MGPSDTRFTRKQLAEFKGVERGQIILVKDEPLAREFFGYSFYVLRFRKYPVARLPPEPSRLIISSSLSRMARSNISLSLRG